MMKPYRICLLIEIAGLAVFWTGCRSVHYPVTETSGRHLREILVERVGEARDAQNGAKEQFQTALEKFSGVVKVPAVELQSKYDQLKSELDKSEASAKEVSSRILAVENVAGAFFTEWQSELDRYTNQDLRRISAQRRRETQDRYRQLIRAMKRAQRRMAPVLGAFRDQVLFLRHNLNARAAASLQGKLVSTESNVASLSMDLDTSMAEANTFIKSMVKE